MLPSLAETWHELDRCDRFYNPEAADYWRDVAARLLNSAVDRSISRYGMGPVYGLIEEVGFRGWRPL